MLVNIGESVVKDEQSTGRCDSLATLAKMHNIAISFVDAGKQLIEIDDRSIRLALNALGVKCDTKDDIELSILQTKEQIYSKCIKGTIAHIHGQKQIIKFYFPKDLVIDGSANKNIEIDLVPENSKTSSYKIGYKFCQEIISPVNSSKIYCEYELELRDDYSIGYYDLKINISHKNIKTAKVIISPLKCKSPHKKLYGFMTQFYSQKSHDSWGIGDFEDLKYLAVNTYQKCEFDFLQINPVHASSPKHNQTASPYLPVSRDYINPIYIRPQMTEEYQNADDLVKGQVDELFLKAQDLNADINNIDRDVVWELKMRALYILFKTVDYQMPPHLSQWAHWCCSQVQNDEHKSYEPEFYAYMQQIARRQLSDAHSLMISAGAEVGLISDLAVGVHPQGADLDIHNEAFIKTMSVGAPPDLYNQKGQNWSQPPFNPQFLEDSGYQLFRNYVVSALGDQENPCAGGLRIDHALGLFRLWWVPNAKDLSPQNGVYVYYDHDILINILVLESHLQNAYIIGEDLGTVPAGARDYLFNRGLLGTSILWFERGDDSRPKPLDKMRELCFGTVHTHDIPPTLGYICAEHVKLRDKFNLLTESYQKAIDSFKTDQENQIDFLINQKCLLKSDLNLPKDEFFEKYVLAMQKILIKSPSLIKAFSFADFVNERRSQNLPGTDREYNNWCIPLADRNGDLVYNEDLFEHKIFKKYQNAIKGEINA